MGKGEGERGESEGRKREREKRKTILLMFYSDKVLILVLKIDFVEIISNRKKK